MREPTKSAVPEPTKIATRWTKGEETSQHLATEMLFSYVGDLVYITFGQTHIPHPGPDGKPATSAEIQPVAKVVLSESGFHKLLRLLNSVSDRIPDRGADAEED